MRRKKEAIEDEDQINWIISYQDGRKEKFRGTAEGAFDHALSKARIFAVEKSDDQSISRKRSRKKKIGIEIGAEVDRFFDDSSINAGKQPTFTIIMGGVCVGKTKLRKEKYRRGHVLIDAAEIFLSLCEDRELDFPSIFEETMGLIGSAIVLRALKEKRNIVTEIIGANADKLLILINAIESTGYEVDLIAMTGDISETWRRNINRGVKNISAYYCEPYHMKWILQAIENLKEP
jgi:hypothetical protein